MGRCVQDGKLEEGFPGEKTSITSVGDACSQKKVLTDEWESSRRLDHWIGTLIIKYLLDIMISPQLYFPSWVIAKLLGN